MCGRGMNERGEGLRQGTSATRRDAMRNSLSEDFTVRVRQLGEGLLLRRVNMATCLAR